MRLQSDFDRFAESYMGEFSPHVRRHLVERRAALIESKLAVRPGRVLDFGCGPGMLVHRLRKAGIGADGLDISPAMVGIARHGPGEFYNLDWLGGEIPRDYDMAVSFGTLHMFSRINVARCLAAMLSSVRPGGMVIAGDNNPLNPYWRILMRKFPMDQLAVRLPRSREIREGLQAGGGRVLREYRWGWMPDFTPAGLMPLVIRIEAVAERIPGIRALSAFHVVLAVKPE